MSKIHCPTCHTPLPRAGLDSRIVKLKKIMQEHGLTRHDIAAICHVAPTSVSRWFRSGVILQKNFSMIDNWIKQKG